MTEPRFEITKNKRGSDEISNKKLSIAEKRDLIIQAGIDAIPYVGGSISTLIFGKKQELRLKRLETFFNKITPEVNAIKDKIAQTGHDIEVFGLYLKN